MPTTHEWRHDDKREEWQYGRTEIDYDQFSAILRVSDSVIEYIEDKNILVRIIRDDYKIDTLPPPLQEWADAESEKITAEVLPYVIYLRGERRIVGTATVKGSSVVATLDWSLLDDELMNIFECSPPASLSVGGGEVAGVPPHGYTVGRK